MVIVKIFRHNSYYTVLCRLRLFCPMSENQETNSEFIKNFKIPLKPASNEKELVNSEKFVSPLISCEVDLEKPMDSNFYQVSSSTEEGIVYHAIPKKRKTSENDEKTFCGRDPAYPPELNAIIQPLSCLLCEVKFNSIQSAQLHYQAKSHYKRIRNWITEWSVKTGAPPIKIAKFVKEGSTGPDAYHCDVCDLALTSLQHANQHYNGKRHKMVASYKKNPSGPGYYHSNGQWIRTFTKTVTDHRFGIGECFLPSSETIVSPSVEIVNTVAETKTGDNIEKPPMASTDPPPLDKSKYCEYCDVHVTSPHHLVMHLKGFKHTKRMKMLNKPPYSVAGDTILACVNNSVHSNEKDVSMYRTPSGCYYCKICNVNVDDEAIFCQHLSSKNHAKNCKNQNDKRKARFK